MIVTTRTYCPHPEGHRLLFVPSSTLYSECYYCPVCNKIYELALTEVPKSQLDEEYTTKRFNEIKSLALVLDARNKVTKADLIKLGLLKK